MSLEHARLVADAVLYEGYLLYPYRSTSRKNQVRWQFGVLGPVDAARRGVGEEPDLRTACLLETGPGAALTVHLRFLQLQARSVERAGASGYVDVGELQTGRGAYVSWDEAVEHELVLGPFTRTELVDGQSVEVEVPGGEDIESVSDAGSEAGRLVRRRRPLHATVRLDLARVEGELDRLDIAVHNTVTTAAPDRDAATRHSLIGAHLLLVAERAGFVSLLEPPEHARVAAAGCEQHRCFPVLAGGPGEHDVLLVSPIILYDHPEVAEQSAGALFDATEIDEILTLRVMTMTEQEKAEARATDPRAAAIIDRCDQMSPESLQALHGVLRDPHLRDSRLGDRTDLMAGVPTLSDDTPWWDPEADAGVDPDHDSVLVDGVQVSRGSRVRVHPGRRADAQDLFFAGQRATVASVHFDVDGSTHIAVTIDSDPAADLHQWYGRYLYFAPDEIEPLERSDETMAQRKEN